MAQCNGSRAMDPVGRVGAGCADREGGWQPQAQDPGVASLQSKLETIVEKLEAIGEQVCPLPDRGAQA